MQRIIAFKKKFEQSSILSLNLKTADENIGR